MRSGQYLCYAGQKDGIWHRGYRRITGPSEVLIIADIKAKAKLLAAEILAQAEHDTLAS